MNEEGYQLKLPLNLETIIPEDDSVRLLSQFVEAMDLTDLYSTYERINPYHQVVTELSPKEWVYNEFTTYVITHNEHTSSENIRYANINPADLVKRLKEKKEKIYGYAVGPILFNS